LPSALKAIAFFFLFFFSFLFFSSSYCYSPSGLLSGDRVIRETSSSLAFNLALSQLKETPDPAIEVVSALHQALIEESDFEVGQLPPSLSLSLSLLPSLSLFSSFLAWLGE
jgi:hypothetical protein